LHEKQKELGSASFPFLAELGKLRDVVAPQIGDTRVLFPEFTPHDEPLRIVQLFELADALFGRHVFKELNAAELLLLARGSVAEKKRLARLEWGRGKFPRQSLDMPVLRCVIFVPRNKQSNPNNAVI
jgi:hypothetical protein